MKHLWTWVSLVVVVVGVGWTRLDVGRVLGLRGFGEESDRVWLVLGGDVMLGRSVNTTMAREDNWRYPFLEIGEYLRGVDVVLVNLEAPFGWDCPDTNTGMIFCARREAVEGLVWAGVDGVSLENNHNTNQGVRGLAMSEEWLEENGVVGVREGEVEVVERKGVRVGMVAVDDVTGRIDEEAMVATIESAERVSDVVVVSVHWGSEYVAEPNERQVRLGRLMVDSGADVVMGHHPHWVQAVEEYSDGVIFYSLGNLVFDQMWSEKTRRGVVAELEVDRRGVRGYRLLPVVIYGYSQPRFEE